MGRRQVGIAAVVAAVFVVAWVARDSAHAPSRRSPTPPSGPAPADVRAPESLGEPASPSSVRAPSPANPSPAPIAVEPDGSRRIHGRLVTREREPVSGASVYLEARRHGAQDLGDEDWPETDRAPSPVPVPLWVETDAQGDFTASIVPTDTIYLAVRASGLARLHGLWDTAELELEPGGELELGTLVLDPGVVARGHVVDERGRPVAGASILYAGLAGSDLADARLATSADDGSFRLDFLPFGHASLEVRASGFVPRKESIYLQAERVDDLRFVLSEAVAITGRVTGAPAGMVLRVRYRSGQDHGDVPCGEDGSFRIDGFAPDSELVCVHASGEEGDIPHDGFEFSLPLKVAPGAQGVELVVPEPVAFRVRLVDAFTHAPVVGARLGDLGDLEFDRSRPAQVREVEPGLYDYTTIVGDPEGTIALAIRREGYQHLAIGQTRNLPGETRDLGTVELQPLAPTRLRVLDARTGMPLADAELSAGVDAPYEELLTASRSKWPDHRDLHWPWSGTSGQDGSTVTFLSPRRVYWISARAPGHTELRKGVVVGTEPPAEIEFPLLRAGAIQVTVRDESGEPGSGFDVRCAMWSTPLNSWRDRPPMRSGPSGRARFQDLEPGLYRLWTGTGPGEVLDRIELTEGETVELQILARSSARARAIGQITEHGVPLPGAMVRLNYEAVPTDKHGRFERTDMDPGETELEVTHPGFGVLVSQQYVLRPGDNRIDVDLRPTAVRGTVRDPQGHPLAPAYAGVFMPGEGKGCVVVLVPDRDERNPYVATSGTDGTFLVPGIQPREGLYLRVSRPGWVDWQVPLVFPEGASEIVIDPVLERGAELKVRIPPENTLDSFRVVAIPLGEERGTGRSSEVEAYSERRQDPSGARWFRTEGLRPGRWRIELRTGWLSPETLRAVEVELVAGANEPIGLTP